MGSREHGLWRLQSPHRAAGVYTRGTGLPTQVVHHLTATDDGALYVGTDGHGLWRVEPGGERLARVEAVPGRRAVGLLASLYLNLGDAQANVGNVAAAAIAVRCAADHLKALPPDGYRQFIAMGIHRLSARVGTTSDVDAAI